MTLDSHLMQLYEKGMIAYGDMITKCRDPESVMQKLQAKQ